MPSVARLSENQPADQQPPEPVKAAAAPAPKADEKKIFSTSGPVDPPKRHSRVKKDDDAS